MQIQVQNQQRKYKKEVIETIKVTLHEALIRAWMRSKAASSEHLKDAEISVNVSFVGNARMREINKETRMVDQTTDVLSFPLHDLQAGELKRAPETYDFEYGRMEDDEDGEEAILENPVFHLGDIIISLEEAAFGAKEFGHSEEREIIYLAVHGFLHLLGYDHQEKADEALMLEEAEEIMASILLDRSSGRNLLSESELDTDEEDEEKDEDVVLTHDNEDFVSGFIAIVGRPNAGKSTLLNRLSGTHLAITSAKAQTTRHNIRSIVTLDDAQLVFVDTPGLHKSKHQLGERMMKDANAAAEDADVILLILDSGRPQITMMEKQMVEIAKRRQKPIVLAINKADEIVKPELLPIIDRYNRLYPFDEIIPISAMNGDGVEDLIHALQSYLPKGPQLFDEDDYTDQSERQLAAEYIREQILHYTHQEIPHGTAVLIDSFEEILADDPVDEYDRKLVRIEASILCDRDSHKGIIIGKNGQSLKRISSSARIRLEELLGCKVYLKCFVKVRPDWRNRQGILNSLGFAGGSQS